MLQRSLMSLQRSWLCSSSSRCALGRSRVVDAARLLGAVAIFESPSCRTKSRFVLSGGRSRCPDQCCRQLFRTGVGRTPYTTRHSKQFVCLVLSVLFFRWYFFSQLAPRWILATWNDQGEPVLDRLCRKRLQMHSSVGRLSSRACVGLVAMGQKMAVVPVRPTRLQYLRSLTTLCTAQVGRGRN